MKKYLSTLLPAIALVFYASCTAQPIQNAKTESVKIYGNCGMCEKNIEKAVLIKGEAKADWDKDSKIAKITFDSSKTSLDVVLKRIAEAGYDSDKYRADDAAYANLHSCCQYDRPAKIETISALPAEVGAVPETAPKQATEGFVKKTANAVPQTEGGNPLSSVYNAYFSLKDALVNTDAKSAASAAKTLSSTIQQVKMGALNETQHETWMKFQKKLGDDAAQIQASSDVEKQRAHFATLSDNLYEVMKVVKPETEVYYDFCPMYNDDKGGYWMSKEKPIRNPFFGDEMMTCGKVKAKIN